MVHVDIISIALILSFSRAVHTNSFMTKARCPYFFQSNIKQPLVQCLDFLNSLMEFNEDRGQKQGEISKIQ